MATFYVKSGSGVAEFAQSTAYSSGDRMVPKLADAGSNHLVAKKWVWECTTAGTSAGAEPTWPASVTVDVTTVTSSGATFTARRPGHPTAATDDWTFATPYLKYGTLAAITAGDEVYVSDGHAESQAAAYDCSPAVNCKILCVDDAAAPPTAMATTATVTTTGNSTLTCQLTTAQFYCYGITFSAGSGAVNVNMILGGGVFESCNFITGGTSGGQVIFQNVAYNCTNCSVKFAAAGSTITGAGAGIWRGGSLLAGGTSPTTLFAYTSPGLVENFDLTNANAAINLTIGTVGFVPRIVFRNIKLPASWSGAVVTGASAVGAEFSITRLENGDNAATNYRLQMVGTYGSVVNETTLVRTGGATDGMTAFSWKVVTVAAAGMFPTGFMKTPEIVKWNATTGSPITVTVEILHDSATALTDKEVWLEVSYLGTSGAPLGTLITDAAASVLATAADQTASSATWTTTGMANPNTQKLSVTFTPQIAGFIHAVVKLCKASKTIYVCPELDIAGVTGLVQRQIPGGQYVNVDRAGMLAIPDMAGT